MLHYDIKNYIKRCNICLVLKKVWHKLYSNLQFLQVHIYSWKNLLIDFIIGLPILTYKKGDSYDSILVIVDWLKKIIYYKPIKVTINALDLIKVIIDIVIRYYSLFNLIVTN